MRTEHEVKKIIKNQVKEKDIIKYIDYQIDNNEKMLLTPQIIKIDKLLTNL